MRAFSPRGQVGGACRGGEMKDRANGWELRWHSLRARGEDYAQQVEGR